MAVDIGTKPTPQAFGSSGGKFHLAKKISSMMPEHTTYVEPYAGGAAVYFYKEPAQKEVLNDMDKEIAFAYRFIRDMTPGQYEELKRKNWVIGHRQFEKVKKMVPKTDVDRFYKFRYLKRGSFRYMMGNINVGQIGNTIGIARLPKVQARLRGVAVNSVDALKMIDKFDSKNTLFYLDPPYPGTSRIGGDAPEFTMEDVDKLVNRLRHIKGKFILSLDKVSARALPHWMNIKRVVTKERTGEGGFRPRTEVLATNYKITKPRRAVKSKRRARYRAREKSLSALM